MVARSPQGCPQRDGRALCARSMWDTALRSSQRALLRGPGTLQIWVQTPSISTLSPESFPGCSMVDTPVKSAPCNVPKAGASREGSRYSQLCFSTLWTSQKPFPAGISWAWSPVMARGTPRSPDPTEPRGTRAVGCAVQDVG